MACSSVLGSDVAVVAMSAGHRITALDGFPMGLGRFFDDPGSDGILAGAIPLRGPSGTLIWGDFRPPGAVTTDT